jgi:hypothetical protein
MASHLNEFISQRLQQEISSQLDLIMQGNNQPAADFASKVRPWGSHQNILGKARHFADGSFGHKGVSCSGLVIEISYSQKEKDLPFLADDYITGSRGYTQAVIGITLEYQKKKGIEAKVIMWRPEFYVRDGAERLRTSKTFEGVFRAKDGSLVNEGQVLRIQLKDFGNKYECPGIGDLAEEITIPFSKMYDLVQEAEESDKAWRKWSEKDHILEEQIDYMPRSPPEELCPED